MQLDVELKFRRRHTCTAVSLIPDMTEVTMFGGVVKRSIESTLEYVSETVVLNFGENNRIIQK